MVQFKKGPQQNKALLISRFGELTRKMWNPRSFKPQVSPHELLQVRLTGLCAYLGNALLLSPSFRVQACSVLSEKNYRPGQQSDPVQFISWFLNTLHRELGGSKKTDSSA